MQSIHAWVVSCVFGRPHLTAGWREAWPRAYGNPGIWTWISLQPLLHCVFVRVRDMPKGRGRRQIKRRRGGTLLLCGAADLQPKLTGDRLQPVQSRGNVLSSGDSSKGYVSARGFASLLGGQCVVETATSRRRCRRHVSTRSASARLPKSTQEACRGWLSHLSSGR
jgi:hypothetical protein